MRLATTARGKKRSLHFFGLLTLSLCILLADHVGISSAALFDTGPSFKKRRTHRLPASVAKQILQFDCQNPRENMEMSTVYETIRLEAVNCSEKIGFQNETLRQPLHIFPVSQQKYSSEFAYLAKGANAFLISVHNKDYKVSIVRF